MKLLERITIEPGKCGGKPCIRGKRIRVSDFLDLKMDEAGNRETTSVPSVFSMVWHDQFKTSVLAQAASTDWSGGVMKDWSNASAKCLPNNPTLQQSITPFLAAHPAYTVALGSLLGIEGPQDTTDPTTSKPTLAGR